VMDWSLFHVEHDYLAVHQRFRRVARQRNVLLKSGASRLELGSWTAELAETGETLHEIRQRRLAEILPAMSSYVTKLCSVEVQIRYEPGWDTEQPLSDLLEAAQMRDRARGYSDVGPQRADLKLDVEGRPAHQVLSRGEGKMFVMALLLGQAQYLSTALQLRPVVLMDELASELDSANRARVLHALVEMGTQVVMTAVSADLVDCSESNSVRMFHVEQGTVTAVL
ncbi:MAG: DNA replication/repair protein RecF, partial [Gammaproteobacteria bacterium]